VLPSDKLKLLLRPEKRDELDADAEAATKKGPDDVKRVSQIWRKQTTITNNTSSGKGG
jgi:hypothetical protein